MKKKIIGLLLRNKLSNSNFDNYNIPYLKKLYHIKFIDISKISLKKNILNVRLQNLKKINNYSIVKDYQSLNKIISKINFLIDLDGSLVLDKNLIKKIHKLNLKKTKTIYLLFSQQPNYFNLNRSNKIYFFYFFLINIIKYKSVNFIFKTVLRFIKIYINSNKNLKQRYNYKYNYVLADSAISEKIANKYFIGSKKIFVHNLDYERHLLKKKYKKRNSNYAIFLDEAIFNHPDNYEFGFKNLIKPGKKIDLYYKKLNFFFRNFEKETNIEIIVAAHPRGLKFDYKKYLNNRKVIKNRTYDLIKNSKLVFCHASTSVNYAIILKKPIVFLNSGLMFELQLFQKIFYYSIETGSKHIFFDKFKSDFKVFLNQDCSKYNFFLRKFIKLSNSRKISMWRELYNNTQKNIII